MFRPTGVLSLGFLFFFPYSLHANQPVTKFDSMVVSATKTEKKVFDIAASTSHIKKTELDKTQPARLHDIFKNIPSVELSGGPRRSAEQPNIRGFGQGRTVLRLDGARQNFNFGHNGSIFVDPDFLSQVDILRGPQSSLYGSGAIGGVIGFKTIEAKDYLRTDETFGAKVKFGYGSNPKELLGNTSLYGRYDEKIDGLASFVIRDSDDLQTGKHKKLRFSGDEIKSGLFKANAYIQDSHKVSGSLLMFKDNLSVLSTPNLEESSKINLNAQNLNIFLSPDLNFPVQRDTQQKTGSIGYDYQNPENPWIQLHSRFYTTDTKIKDKINSNLLPGLKRFDKTKMSTHGLDVYNTTTIQGNHDFECKFTYGVEHYKDDQKGYRNGNLRAQYPRAHAKTTGLYFREEMTFFQRFIFATGYRHDAFSAHPSKSLKQPKMHAHKGSPSASATFKPLDWLMAYTSYAEAFRAPQLSELYGGGVHFMVPFRNTVLQNMFVPNPNLVPEHAKTKEVGAGLRFDNIIDNQDSFRTKAAFFVTHTKDFIEPQVSFNPRVASLNVTRINNLTSVRIRGFEAEAAYDSTYVFSGLGFSTLNGFDKTFATRVASVPPAKFAFSLGGKLPQLDTIFGWKGILTRKQNRIPNRQTERSLTRKTHGFGTHDVFLNWTPQHNWTKGLDVNLGIDNVFNKYYRKHLTNLPEMGRNFKLALGYRL